MTDIQYLDRAGGRLAYRRTEGRGPAILFLPGYMSDMAGAKALALEAWCAEQGRAFLRFDYGGCGLSDGDFEAQSLADWRDDAAAMIGLLAPDPVVLVGSSMGAWIALHLSLRRKDRVAALVLIAPAIDMTEALIAPGLSPERRAQLERDGQIALGPQTILTRTLLEEGRRHCLLPGPIAYDGPVRILQGMQDPDVPWEHAIRVAGAIASTDVEIRLSKSGDHRLSTPGDLVRLAETLAALR